MKRVLLISLLLSGCAHVEQNWYAETGPAYDFGSNADNSDIPWVVEVGVRYKRCKLSVTHVSSVLAGRPLNKDAKDDYAITAFYPSCSVGPGK